MHLGNFSMSRQRYKFFFPSKYAESETLKVAEGHSPRVFKFSRSLNYSELNKLEIGGYFPENFFKKKHENHWMMIQKKH